MTFEQFQASRHDVAPADAPPHMADLIDYDDSIDSVLVYFSETWIAHRADGQYWLLICRDEYVTDDLPRLEALLFNFYIEECV
jgi:hypothetical protein